ncbi:hypothetical protein CRYUN_Cryun32bG0016400 [Craigia yunnanensis]
MADNQGRCFECGTIITVLIRECNVRASPSTDKSYFIGRFMTGLPNFSKKKNAENKWSLQKGLQGRQLTDALRVLHLSSSAVACMRNIRTNLGCWRVKQARLSIRVILKTTVCNLLPAYDARKGVCSYSAWFLVYNFNKVAQYKQPALKEAEEKMKNGRKTADGYERWMMKAANNGAVAFGEVEKFDDKDSSVADKGEEEEEEEAARKNRFGLNEKSGDDDEEGPRGGDLDLDDDDIEKSDDWEHEEIFTDDDEAVGNDPEERDLAPEVSAPPEIKEDEDEEDEEQEGGLSKSGKELKKLLGKAGGLNDLDADDDDDDEDVDDDISFNPVLAPKQKDSPKEEPADNGPTKPAPSASTRGTPTTSKSAKGKRKANDDDTNGSNGTPLKKVKSESESKSSVKEESAPASKGIPSSAKAGSRSAAGASSSSKAGSASTAGPVTEEEIRAVLLQKAPVTTSDLVAKFKARLKSAEDKKAFADIRRISKIQ